MQVYGKLWLKRKIAFFLIFLFLTNSTQTAFALTKTENFGASAPGSISSNLTVREGGNAITRTTATACFAHFSSYSGFTGGSLHLYGVRNDVVFTFSDLEIVTSFSFQSLAVNGTQHIVATYENGSTSQFSPPNSISLQTTTFTGNGSRILSFKVVGTPTGSTCNGSGTPSGDNDYWIMDNISWTYTVATADTTAPTFTSSSSFSVAENIATSVTAATIRVSESATVTISSGADAARFNISRSETNTAIIKFNVSPDFEAPADVGGNNVYEITLTATDAASNAGTQSITITVTDVVDTSSFNSLALAGSATTATFRTAVVITANVTVAARVTFRVNGKILPGCKNKLATGSGSSFSATCSWRPSNRGQVTLAAAATPTGAGISSTTSNPVSIMVGNRTGVRVA